MSFENHRIVAAHLALLNGNLDITHYQVFILNKLARELQAELQKHEEQAALTNVDYSRTARRNIERQLNEAANCGNLEAVTVYSQALQRIS